MTVLGSVFYDVSNLFKQDICTKDYKPYLECNFFIPKKTVVNLTDKKEVFKLINISYTIVNTIENPQDHIWDMYVTDKICVIDCEYFKKLVSTNKILQIATDKYVDEIVREFVETILSDDVSKYKIFLNATFKNLIETAMGKSSSIKKGNGLLFNNDLEYRINRRNVYKDILNKLSDVDLIYV